MHSHWHVRHRAWTRIDDEDGSKSLTISITVPFFTLESNEDFEHFSDGQPTLLLIGNAITEILQDALLHVKKL